MLVSNHAVRDATVAMLQPMGLLERRRMQRGQT